MSPRPAKPFEDDCQSSIGALRASLISLCDDIGANPEAPQEIARKLGVNKTLTWSVSKMMRAPTHLEALPHLPGTAALEQFLKAASKQGANRARVESVRSAAVELQRLVEEHFGDRGTLDLVLDGIENNGNDGLASSRKLAFRGNSGVFGVQAKTRILTGMLAPNASDPSRLDMVMVSGYIGFRRLRGNVRWPLFKVRSWADADEPVSDYLGGWQPIDPSVEQRKTALMPQFSSSSVPTVREEMTEEGLDLILSEGPVGNHGAIDCFRGEFCRAAASRYASTTDDTGEFGVSVTTPSEDVICDILFHRDLTFVRDAQLLAFGRIFSHGMKTGSSTDDSVLLPIRQTPVELSGRPPVVSTPRVPRYADLFQTVCKRLEWNPDDFKGIRVAMDFPPLGSSLVLRFPLPNR